MKSIVDVINESLISESRAGEWLKAMLDIAKKSAKDIKSNFRWTNQSLHQKWDEEDAAADYDTKINNLPSNIRSLYNYFLNCNKKSIKDGSSIENYYTKDDFNKICRALCDINDIEIAKFVVVSMLKGGTTNGIGKLAYMVGNPECKQLIDYKDKWDYYAEGLKMLIKKYPELDA